MWTPCSSLQEQMKLHSCWREKGYSIDCSVALSWTVLQLSHLSQVAQKLASECFGCIETNKHLIIHENHYDSASSLYYPSSDSGINYYLWHNFLFTLFLLLLSNTTYSLLAHYTDPIILFKCDLRKGLCNPYCILFLNTWKKIDCLWL